MAKTKRKSKRTTPISQLNTRATNLGTAQYQLERRSEDLARDFARYEAQRAGFEKSLCHVVSKLPTTADECTEKHVQTMARVLSACMKRLAIIAPGTEEHLDVLAGIAAPPQVSETKQAKRPPEVKYRDLRILKLLVNNQRPLARDDRYFQIGKTDKYVPARTLEKLVGRGWVEQLKSSVFRTTEKGKEILATRVFDESTPPRPTDKQLSVFKQLMNGHHLDERTDGISILKGKRSVGNIRTVDMRHLIGEGWIIPTRHGEYRMTRNAKKAVKLYA